MPSIFLATEDSLSEEVACRLIAEIGSGVEIRKKIRKNGFGYLKASIDKFCNIAQQSPLLLITDLDKATCATSLISNWMGSRALPDKLLFRVAVREIEAWLLADYTGMETLLGHGVTKLPYDPDLLPDPKGFLLRLATSAPRVIQNDLVVETGAVASQGLGYNQRLGDFVRNTWDPKQAALRSNSLLRALNRLQELAEGF